MLSEKKNLLFLLFLTHRVGGEGRNTQPDGHKYVWQLYTGYLKIRSNLNCIQLPNYITNIAVVGVSKMSK
jgi:hypothetical protein